MRRVLAPGGRLVSVTPVVPRSRLGGTYRLVVRAIGLIDVNSLGSRPLDPSRDLARSGFEPVRGRYVRGGYPSLCVLARRAARDRAQ